MQIIITCPCRHHHKYYFYMLACLHLDICVYTLFAREFTLTFFIDHALICWLKNTMAIRIISTQMHAYKTNSTIVIHTNINIGYETTQRAIECTLLYMCVNYCLSVTLYLCIFGFFLSSFIPVVSYNPGASNRIKKEKDNERKKEMTR